MFVSEVNHEGSKSAVVILLDAPGIFTSIMVPEGA